MLQQQGSQIDEVDNSEPRPSRGHDHERVLGLDARPARRHGRHMAVAVAVEDPILTPVVAPLDDVDLLPDERMKRMRDPDRRGHSYGATCSRLGGQTPGA